MNMMLSSKPGFNRRALATEAMQAATATRAKAKLDQSSPICIYGLCETLGVAVRFNNINMEGMYQRGVPPRIHLCARKGVRRSMLQATTFDPGRDHVASAQLGFPCLQQVSFEPTAAGLVVNAFYATQQKFDKAYGNYLGLAQLGAFMAHEMATPLARLNVMAGIAKLERITKSDADFAPLVTAVQALTNPHSAPAVRPRIAAPAVGATI